MYFGDSYRKIQKASRKACSARRLRMSFFLQIFLGIIDIG